MLDSTPVNSSANIGTSGLGHCACCHEFGPATPHWDRVDIALCGTCRTLLFQMVGHGSITHTIYAFMGRLDAGDL